MTKFKVISSLCLVVLFAVSCGSLTANLHARELKAAYETIDATTLEAERTGDTSKLSKVLTQKILPDTVKSIEKRSSQVIIIGPDARTTHFWVSEYNPPEAIVIVGYSYTRHYIYNRETGELTYEEPAGEITHTFKERMYQEDGVWKLDEVLENLDRQ